MVAKSYAESGSQTTQVDPENHLKNFGNLRLISNNESQTEVELTAKSDDDSEASKSDDSDALDQTRELEKRLNPTTSRDFSKLQSELLQWRKREERKITITSRNEEHKQEMKSLLLKKEAHILRKIEQLKNEAVDRARAESIEEMMEEMARPQQWEVSGGVVEVDTQATCRARELKAVHDELNKKVDKVSTRIEVLEKAKALVEKVDHSGLAKDIGSLLDRELQTLQRGTDLGPEMMEGLRKRLSNQFTKLVTRLNGEAMKRLHLADEPKAKLQLQKPSVDQ